MKHTGKANFPRNNSNSILILNIAKVSLYMPVQVHVKVFLLNQKKEMNKAHKPTYLNPFIQ